MVLTFDHAILGVADLGAAATRLLAEHGLHSLPGGRHTGHGTGNRIVPLGPDYIELMSVLDPREAADSPLGRWVTGRLAEGDGLLALCLQTHDIETVADRLSLPVLPMSRTKPDGAVLAWRLTGLEAAMGNEQLPFFIQWDIPEQQHPGREAALHRVEPRGIAWVEVGGDPGRLQAWVGPHSLDLRLTGGPPGIRAVGIRTATGEIVIR
jgi:hypothetical protein